MQPSTVCYENYTLSFLHGFCMYLLLHPVPKPPQNFTVIAINDSLVKLYWQPDTLAQQYTVFWKKGPSPGTVRTSFN
jgi:hypothetical protein